MNKINWQDIKDNVFTKHGPVEIENIKIGDEVLGKNEAGEYEFYSVTDIGFFEKKDSRAWLIVNESIKFAWHQSIYINGKLKHARELQPGQSLETIDGGKIKVETARKVKDFTPKIKLTIDAKRSWLDKLLGRKKHSAHTFFINGVLVHNASRYWVGGTGDWDDNTNHWAATSGGSPGASLPTSTDDVLIDTNSGFGAGGTLSLQNGDGECNNFTANSGHSYIIDDNTNGSNLDIFGSLVLESGITFTGEITVRLLATASGKTVTTAGVILYNLEIIGVGGGWTLQDDLEITENFLQNNGTFDANDKNVTAGDIRFSASAGFTPTVIMGSGTWNSFYGSWLIQEDAEVVTITPETSTIKLLDVGQFTGGGKTYNNLWITANSQINGSNTFNDLKIDAGLSVNCEATKTQTVTSFTASGSSGNLIVLSSGSTDDTNGNPIVSEFELIGSELITNGGFTGNANGWTLGSGWSYGTNNLVHTGETADYEATQAISIEAGKYYLVTFDIIATDELWGTNISLGGKTNSLNALPVGSYQTVILTVDNTSPFAFSQNKEVTIDNISVKEVKLKQHTLSKSSGVVACDYLDLSNSNATGGATWYAGANSNDIINNDGWIFTAPPLKTNHGYIIG